MALLAVDLTGPTASSLRRPARVGVGVGEDGWVDDGEGLAEPDGAGVQVQVGPFQAAQLAVAGAGRRRQHRPGAKPWAEGLWSAASNSSATCSGASATTSVGGHRRWGGVGGDVVGEQPPGDRLGQGAVQAAVHGQDVLGGQPARLAVPAAADGQPVVDGLDLQRGELLERPGADVGSDVVAQQRGVAGHGAGAQAGADMGQPAVQVLVDGELGRVEREAVAAAGERVGQGGLGLGAGGVAAQGLEPAGAVGAAGQLQPGVPADAAARALAGGLGVALDALALQVAAASHRRWLAGGWRRRAGPAGPVWGCGYCGRCGPRPARRGRPPGRAGCARPAGWPRPRGR